MLIEDFLNMLKAPKFQSKSLIHLHSVQCGVELEDGRGLLSAMKGRGCLCLVELYYQSPPRRLWCSVHVNVTWQSHGFR